MEMPNQGKETILEQESCSPTLLPLTLQRATLTDADRNNHEIPKGVEMYTVTIGMHTFPFFSANVALQRKFNVTDATVRYELTDGEPVYAEQTLRIVVDVGGAHTVIDGEIFSVDSHSLRSQFLTELEVLEIERAMDPAYWQRRAEETKNGIIHHIEGESTMNAGAAADLGYASGGEDVMEDRALIGGDIFGVFDGIGGSENGEIAATISAETFHEILSDKSIKSPSPAWRLRKAFAVADERIRAYAKKAKLESTPGTTAAVAYIEVLPDGMRKAYIASQGDSRVYLCRVDGSVFPITIDDAKSLEFALLPELVRQRARGNNVVSKYVGCSNRSSSYADRIPVREVVLQPGEFLVFTTDGIHDVLTTHDAEKERLNGYLYHEIQKMLGEIHRNRSSADIGRFATKPPSENIRNPVGDDFSVRIREISAQYWEQEKTLTDAIRAELHTKSPQVIADAIITAVREVNVLRRKSDTITGRTKTDNRAVVVAM